MAVVYGGAIGLEREVRGRAAGLRTMILVCLAATVIMIVSAALPGPFEGEASNELVRFDPGRIASGIVTGIGFLGGAVVVKLGDLVRGVTTAASIWFAAGLGIVIGLRHYALATATTLVALAVLWLLNYAGNIIPSRLYRVIVVSVARDKSHETCEAVEQLLSKRSVRLMDMSATEDTQQELTEIAFHVRSKQKFQAHEMVKLLGGLDGVRSVSWHSRPPA
ncbi:MAG: MgtC/SapB family protein [Proteobacteria bacterium]|nr:MgtC/SapB family protein [Pseudomonadota bacterium]